MPMIRLYVFLLDFLIPFLCDPDLQYEREGLERKGLKHSLNIELDLQSLFGLHVCTAVLIG